MRQGDPLSPILFILAMEVAVRAAMQIIGFDLEGNHIDALAYADNLVLFAVTPEGLQEELDGLNDALNICGMTLSIRKSRCLTVVKGGTRKCIVLVLREYKIEGGGIQGGYQAEIFRPGFQLEGEAANEEYGEA